MLYRTCSVRFVYFFFSNILPRDLSRNVIPCFSVVNFWFGTKAGFDTSSVIHCLYMVNFSVVAFSMLPHRKVC